MKKSKGEKEIQNNFLPAAASVVEDTFPSLLNVFMFASRVTSQDVLSAAVALIFLFTTRNASIFYVFSEFFYFLDVACIASQTDQFD